MKSENHSPETTRLRELMKRLEPISARQSLESDIRRRLDEERVTRSWVLRPMYLVPATAAAVIMVLYIAVTPLEQTAPIQPPAPAVSAPLEGVQEEKAGPREAVPVPAVSSPAPVQPAESQLRHGPSAEQADSAVPASIPEDTSPRAAASSNRNVLILAVDSVHTSLMADSMAPPTDSLSELSDSLGRE